MKKYKTSDLSNTKRREVLEEARKSPVLIQKMNTNGKEVLEEFILTKRVNDE